MLYVCMYVCMYVCVYVFMYVCMLKGLHPGIIVLTAHVCILCMYARHVAVDATPSLVPYSTPHPPFPIISVSMYICMVCMCSIRCNFYAQYLLGSTEAYYPLELLVLFKPIILF